MRVILRESALEDLDRIHAWIAKDNPSAANNMVARIRDRISFLEVDALAHMGRPGLVAGTRELSEHPYIIVYTSRGPQSEIVVLAIMHGARDRGR